MGRRSLRPPLFFAGMQCRSKCYGGWQNGETCAVLEGGSVFSDPLAVDIHAAFASRYEGRGMGSRSLRPPLFFAGMQCRRKRGVALKNGVPYLYLHTSTQTLHVSRLPGDQRTRSYPPKPRRFLHSASHHSTLI